VILDEGTEMAERSPIFRAKTDNQKIGYVEGAEAFHLSGNKRCNYNRNTGNLLELENGRTIGHVSLAGHFVGVSWIADELFPQPDAITPSQTPPDEATSNPAEPSFQSAIAQEPGAPDEPALADLALQSQPTSLDEPSAGDAAALLMTSLDEPVANDSVTLPASSDGMSKGEALEAPLSGDAERALEMIRTTLAMKFSDTNNQTATDVATQMRQHIARSRKKAPRARVTIRYSMKGFDRWNTSGNTATHE
jgi:hypothetical protein